MIALMMAAALGAGAADVAKLDWLAGTWTQGVRTLPVEIGFSTSYDGPPRARRYAEMTDEPDAVVEARAAKFLKAAVRGDRAAAADAVSYPLRVNGDRPKTIRNNTELLTQWNSIFTPALLVALRDAVPVSYTHLPSPRD